MIQLKQLNKNYGSTKALDGLSLTVPEGELFAFLGPNGAGKTTTIRILNGLTRFNSGRVLIGGIDIARKPLETKKLCGLVAQHNNLDSELTVKENLDIHGRLFALSRTVRRARTEELLGYVDLSDRANDLVKTLSGGLKRRLMIARALMHNPRLLFLDEPTVGLDPAIRRRIWSLIKKVCQDGVTIFLTTHYIEEAEFLADRVAFINQGRLAELDTPKVLMMRLGQWAVDRFKDSEMQTHYFASREAAHDFMKQDEMEFTLRRVNLEDAFLALTGRKVQ
jgi:ABC-2 type transport system ATP-binding protein